MYFPLKYNTNNLYAHVDSSRHHKNILFYFILYIIHDSLNSFLELKRREDAHFHKGKYFIEWLCMHRVQPRHQQ